MRIEGENNGGELDSIERTNNGWYMTERCLIDQTDIDLSITADNAVVVRLSEEEKLITELSKKFITKYI